MNSVTLVGRLSVEPELRFLPNSERPVVKFRLAVKNTYANKVDYFNIVAYDAPANYVADYITKGWQVALKGRLNTRSYVNESTQQTVYVTEIIAEEVNGLSAPLSKNNVKVEEPNLFTQDSRELMTV